MVNWGQDIMRHTYASYHLAYHCSRQAHELGNRDTTMLLLTGITKKMLRVLVN